VKVNAVRQMLDRMNQEIENLRKILGAHEDKMTEAGLLAESHREILDKQFWAAVRIAGNVRCFCRERLGASRRETCSLMLES